MKKPPSLRNLNQVHGASPIPSHPRTLKDDSHAHCSPLTAPSLRTLSTRTL